VSFKIKIEETRVVETLTRREWVKGGPDGREKDGEYGYSRQVPQQSYDTRTVLEMVADNIDVVAVAKAVLDNTKPSI
jgi:hypothetical protein